MDVAGHIRIETEIETISAPCKKVAHAAFHSVIRARAGGHQRYYYHVQRDQQPAINLSNHSPPPSGQCLPLNKKGKLPYLVVFEKGAHISDCILRLVSLDPAIPQPQQKYDTLFTPVTVSCIVYI